MCKIQSVFDQLIPSQLQLMLLNWVLLNLSIFSPSVPQLPPFVLFLYFVYEPSYQYSVVVGIDETDVICYICCCSITILFHIVSTVTNTECLFFFHLHLCCCYHCSGHVLCSSLVVAIVVEYDDEYNLSSNTCSITSSSFTMSTNSNDISDSSFSSVSNDYTDNAICDGLVLSLPVSLQMIYMVI